MKSTLEIILGILLVYMMYLLTLLMASMVYTLTGSLFLGSVAGAGFWALESWFFDDQLDKEGKNGWNE